MTPDEAIALSETEFWKDMPARAIAEFQLFEPLLCMPFDVFHQALEQSLGRPVWTHELGLDMDGIKREFLGERDAPSMEEIIALIPAEKRGIVAA